MPSDSANTLRDQMADVIDSKTGLGGESYDIVDELIPVIFEGVRAEFRFRGLDGEQLTAAIAHARRHGWQPETAHA